VYAKLIVLYNEDKDKRPYMKKLTDNRIGMWGCGATGKSIVHFLRTIGCEHIGIYDDHIDTLPPDVQHTSVTHVRDKHTFFQSHDYIIPSPGIDISPYQKDMPPIITECDIFFAYWKKPVIAITGTLGKTTVTHYITELINNAGQRAVSGGNIGRPMLTLFDDQETIDIAVLELSSFQLAYAERCTPDLAIITNIYPNHLDWHQTPEAYLQAKLCICSDQQTHQKVLIPQSLADSVSSQARIHTFTDARDIPPMHNAYTITDNTLWHGTTKKHALPHTPETTHLENHCIALAALDILDIPITEHKQHVNEHTQHRLEHVAERGGITIYNDSKSTIMQATVAATHMLAGRSITLIIGGTSKGVDRADQLQHIPDHVTRIICFGAEAAYLSHYCRQYGFVTQTAKTLHEATILGLGNTAPRSVLLFSPGGASFDLFSNYQERGNAFKQIIETYNFTYQAPDLAEISHR
jgi:UDP-N-acetylmuramoylalanine--D-glutamate ligase